MPSHSETIPTRSAPNGGARFWTPSAQSAAAGGVLALAFPPYPFGFLGYGAIAFALYACGIGRTATPSWRTVAWRAWTFGTVFHVCTLYWTSWVAVPGMLVMTMVLGLYISAVFVGTALLTRWLGARALWMFPILWTAHEYLRGIGTLAFPWTNLSLSQVKYPLLIQYADITGDLGVTFVLATVNVLALTAAKRLTAPRQRPILRHVVILALLVVLPYLYGWGTVKRVVADDARGDTVRVAVLQGDIDSFEKWSEDHVDRSFAVYETQTRAANRRGADLVVWPETAAPIYLRADADYRRELRELSQECEAALLVGTLEYTRLPDDRYLRYNAALVAANGRIERDYHAKLQLVPLGEMIPFADRLRFLDKLDVGGAHFTAGDKYVLFDHAHGPFAAAICYESAFPDIMRRFAAEGARYFVNITNDGWYGFTSGPTQHAAIAVFRAIETRRPIARSANTGISGFIDRTGRYHERTAQYVPDTRIYDMPLGAGDRPPTLFVRYGMFVGQSCTGVSVIILLAGFAISRIGRGRKEPVGRPENGAGHRA